MALFWRCFPKSAETSRKQLILCWFGPRFLVVVVHVVLVIPDPRMPPKLFLESTCIYPRRSFTGVVLESTNICSTKWAPQSSKKLSTFEHQSRRSCSKWVVPNSQKGAAQSHWLEKLFKAAQSSPKLKAQRPSCSEAQSCPKLFWAVQSSCFEEVSCPVNLEIPIGFKLKLEVKLWRSNRFEVVKYSCCWRSCRTPTPKHSRPSTPKELTPTPKWQSEDLHPTDPHLVYAIHAEATTHSNIVLLESSTSNNFAAQLEVQTL